MKAEKKLKFIKEITVIIQNECDGTFSNDPEDWYIANPSKAPKIILENIISLLTLKYL